MLRVIPSDGDHDFEAIEYLGRNRYVLSRERDGCSPPTTLAGTRLSCRYASYTLTLDVDRKSDNAGFSNASCRRGENALIVAQERKVPLV